MNVLHSPWPVSNTEFTFNSNYQKERKKTPEYSYNSQKQGFVGAVKTRAPSVFVLPYWREFFSDVMCVLVFIFKPVFKHHLPFTSVSKPWSLNQKNLE